MVNLIYLMNSLKLMARKLGAIVRYQNIRYCMVGKLRLVVVYHLFDCRVCKEVKFEKP